MWPAGVFPLLAVVLGRFRPHNPGVVRANDPVVGVSDQIRVFLLDAGFRCPLLCGRPPLDAVECGEESPRLFTTIREADSYAGSRPSATRRGG